jgi:hypothetical protein
MKIRKETKKKVSRNQIRKCGHFDKLLQVLKAKYKTSGGQKLVYVQLFQKYFTLKISLAKSKRSQKDQV